jgi:drug/metabolite transporter (DMT)-like permease
MPPEVWLLFLGVLVSSVSQVVLKLGANRPIPKGATRWKSFRIQYVNVRVIGGYTLLALSMGLAIAALTKVDLKYGAVVESLGYACVMVLSRVFLGERITARKVIGNLIIISGVIVFASSFI